MNKSDLKIVIAGGNGFLGASLAAHLVGNGYSPPIILTRRELRTRYPSRCVRWDGRSLGPWVEALEHSSGLVNLCGRSVDCVKTPDHQDEILRSRIESTRVLGQAMAILDRPPPVWVQMSTAHIYGDPPSNCL